MRTISLDTETTGFDFEKGHRIVEIGCVEMEDLIRTGNRFHVYINPEREVPEEAFKVHGLDYKFLKDKPKFENIIDNFIEFIGNSPLVIHNAPFDMAFLNGEFKKTGYPVLGNKVIDTLTLARKRVKLGRHNLDALCNYYKINKSNRTLHGALIDADLLAQVYLELEGGAEFKMNLSVESDESVIQDKLSEAIKKFENKNNSISSINFPIVKPNETELCEHKEILQKLLV